MCVLGVGVSSGLGPVLVEWAREQREGSVTMRAVFGAQLPSSQLPAAACVDTMSLVGSRPSNGGSLGYFTCVILCRMFFAEYSKSSTQKNRDMKHVLLLCSPFDNLSYMFYSDMSQILQYCNSLAPPVPQWSLLLF